MLTSCFIFLNWSFCFHRYFSFIDTYHVWYLITGIQNHGSSRHIHLKMQLMYLLEGGGMFEICPCRGEPYILCFNSGVGQTYFQLFWSKTFSPPPPPPMIINERSLKAASYDPIFGANYYPNSKKLVMRINISINWKWNNAVIIVGSKTWIVWTDLNNCNILKAQVKTLIVVASNSYLSVIHYPKDVQKCEVLLLISPGA